MQYHFVRDMVEEKKVSLDKVDTLKNVADSLEGAYVLKTYLSRGRILLSPKRK